jgi:hypothetical protein
MAVVVMRVLRQRERKKERKEERKKERRKKCQHGATG